MENKRPILIIGCGGGATMYASMVFSEGGVLLGHERIERDGMASWLLSIGFSSVNPPRHEGNAVSFRRFMRYFRQEPIILHQVRHPLKNISTFQKTRGKFWNYICYHIPEIERKEEIILRCMKYWLYWNKKASEIADYTYRVENFFGSIGEICRIIERKESLLYIREMKMISNKINTRIRRRYKTLNWNNLMNTDKSLCEEIISLAKQYGYSDRELYETT